MQFYAHVSCRGSSLEVNRSIGGQHARTETRVFNVPAWDASRAHACAAISANHLRQLSARSFALRTAFVRRKSVLLFFSPAENIRVFLVPSLRIIIILRHVVVQPYPVPVIFFSRTFCGRMDMIFYFIFLTSNVLLDYFFLTMRTLL